MVCHTNQASPAARPEPRRLAQANHRSSVDTLNLLAVLHPSHSTTPSHRSDPSHPWHPSPP